MAGFYLMLSHENKGGTLNFFLNAQRARKPLRKCRLAGAQLPDKCYDPRRPDGARQCYSGPFGLLGISCPQNNHKLKVNHFPINFEYILF